MLLTAGHVVRHDGKKDHIDRAYRIEARIGYHLQEWSEGQNVEVCKGIGVVILHAWETSGWEWRHDLALIKLKSPFVDLVPAFYSAPPPGKFEVSVFGFPSEKQEKVGDSCPAGKCSCMHRVQGSATINESTEILEYKISTATGMYLRCVLSSTNKH